MEMRNKLFLFSLFPTCSSGDVTVTSVDDSSSNCSFGTSLTAAASFVPAVSIAADTSVKVPSQKAETHSVTAADEGSLVLRISKTISCLYQQWNVFI